MEEEGDDEYQLWLTPAGTTGAVVCLSEVAQRKRHQWHPGMWVDVCMCAEQGGWTRLVMEIQCSVSFQASLHFSHNMVLIPLACSTVHEPACGLLRTEALLIQLSFLLYLLSQMSELLSG